jgi:predicted DNA-binding transcriptional regulator AlpA
MKKLLSEPDARAAAGNPSKATLKNWRALYGFPQPIKLGGRIFFLADEIDAWLDARIAARDVGATVAAVRKMNRDVHQGARV